MLALVALSLSAFAALDWAAYSPLDVPLDIELRKNERDDAVARVYAAKGESEGIHLAVTARRKTAHGVIVEAEPAAKDVPPPVVYRLWPVTGPEIKTECLDALEPARPAELAPGETAHYWIRYTIPPDAKAGIRQSALKLREDGERATEVPVRLEIFNFALPERPSLPNVFYLDRVALRRAFDLKDSQVDAWLAIYGAFSGYRLGLSVWDGSGLMNGKDPAALKEQLTLLSSTHPAAIDLSGGNGAGWKAFPAPEPGQSIDPLNIALNGATAGIADVTFTAAFDAFPAREAWPASIGLLRRLSTGSQLLRVAAAPLHPAFQGVVDAWAIPFRACSPPLLARLRSAAGIGGPRSLPPARMSASASADNTLGVPYESSPEDAADGSPFTAWIPGRTKPGGEDAWWQADFDRPVPVQQVVFSWLPGHDTDKVELYTSLDGTNYNRANVKWQFRRASTPIELPSARATLRFPGPLLGIRAVLHLTPDPKVPAIAEVSLGAPPEADLLPPARPIKPWLGLELDTFPTTYPGRAPAEPRLIGWVCYFGGLDGVLGASLNVWPNSLLTRADDAPFDLPKDMGDFLYYPLHGVLQPSLRLERLRDGFEDYEYLRLLNEAETNEDKLPANATDLLKPLPLSPTPKDEEVTTWARHILETRIRIGRALSGK